MSILKKTTEGRSTVRSRKQIVPSPYWKEGYNPNFPHGCSRSVSQKIISANNPTIVQARVISIERLKKESREALKEAKKSCVNKKNLTTIYSTAL